MIKNIQPLSLAEVKEIVGKIGIKQPLESYLKKFLELNKEKAEKIKTELSALDNLKIKEEHIIKIVDLLPEDAADINKIFVDVGLEEDEIKKILEIVAKYT